MWNYCKISEERSKLGFGWERRMACGEDNVTCDMCERYDVWSETALYIMHFGSSGIYLSTHSIFCLINVNIKS